MRRRTLDNGDKADNKHRHNAADEARQMRAPVRSQRFKGGHGQCAAPGKPGREQHFAEDGSDKSFHDSPAV